MPLWFTQHDDLVIIQAWADRSIPGTFERSARSLRLRNRAWTISFDAGGRKASFAQSALASRAPPYKPGHCFCAEIADTKSLPHPAPSYTVLTSPSMSGAGPPL